MLRSDARHRGSRRRDAHEGATRPCRLDDQPPAEARRALWLGRLDVIVGMVFSVAIMFAIIVSSAATLGSA